MLDWDSAFFGFPVARIDASVNKCASLKEMLSELRKRGIALAYWDTSPDDAEINAVAVELGGRLVDTRHRFRRQITPSNAPKDQFKRPVITGANMQTLIQLALECATHSRFRADPQVPEGLCEELYRIWMYKSITGELANALLIEWDGGDPIGFVTLYRRGKMAVIGLIAVAADRRNQGIARRLLNRAAEWSAADGCSEVELVTQARNTPAVSAYERIGFTLHDLTNVYHFWLSDAWRKPVCGMVVGADAAKRGAK
ncbi:MAG: GNAT family N-acetyltransferase [Alphaproteobacteria bacterium]|nr:GNAT family N-acetyltransferase [Alphaproteobacteria bacterium]